MGDGASLERAFDCILKPVAVSQRIEYQEEVGSACEDGTSSNSEPGRNPSYHAAER
jgi:hypothetical protein